MDEFATDIGPVLARPRPLVSVVIPVYEPNDYLCATLKSVLQQDMGPASMEVMVVDDASPKAETEALINKVDASGRVKLIRNHENLGLAKNWNKCIHLSAGEVIHILHQDDLLSDKFYRRMLPVFKRRKDVGMAFCRHAFMDESGRVTHETEKERWCRGRLANWIEKIAIGQRIQCPAVLVRRSTYESLGGYRLDLTYALDWEMWVRIAAHYAVWYDPKLMAYYRIHSQNETSRLASAGKLTADEFKAIEIFSRHLPSDRKGMLTKKAQETIQRKAEKMASGAI